MEIYNLRRGDRFKIKTDLGYIPKGQPEPNTQLIYKHEKLDGAYSRNGAPDGSIVHLAAWTDVEVIE